ncbi:MAG: flagellar basal body rod protein FlgC [Gammaproteobacteria bacterium]|jgi:flagellar basal-body rod protein FlgC|nr:flagellar basal body rod protein FlgC [Gammaproteobacteria bacterium]MBT3723260.1 flagellar basal body rod protein FlgC [Gammaproteobacteria bacterium]MBT4077833.1 flagellar basal body rod protein FlgC [Gammaproteobacteria bacterium]MBT4196508.1 flagellar basal body rod protein FlgC [Gammaproteobacteria bacterium]MBT4450194.1 flagellar basal body rod protein FlgC [Gammaproteobacteria bacterium]
MGLLANFQISGSAISAQSMRLNTTASNMANAETVASSEQEAYRARETVFQSYLYDKARPAEAGVAMLGVVESAAAIRTQYDPENPLANEQGYVFTSNVDTVEEMVNMLSSSRSYQNNVEVLNTSKELMVRTLSLGN